MAVGRPSMMCRAESAVIVSSFHGVLPNADDHYQKVRVNALLRLA